MCFLAILFMSFSIVYCLNISIKCAVLLFDLCLGLLAVFVDFFGPEPKEVLQVLLNPPDLGDSVLDYG